MSTVPPEFNVITLGWRQKTRVKCIDGVTNLLSVNEMVVPDKSDKELKSKKNEYGSNIAEILQIENLSMSNIGLKNYCHTR